jgi:hypothetical protein
MTLADPRSSFTVAVTARFSLRLMPISIERCAESSELTRTEKVVFHAGRPVLGARRNLEHPEI